jgi:hypothetical protein
VAVANQHLRGRPKRKNLHKRSTAHREGKKRFGRTGRRPTALGPPESAQQETQSIANKRNLCFQQRAAAGPVCLLADASQPSEYVFVMARVFASSFQRETR